MPSRFEREACSSRCARVSSYTAAGSLMPLSATRPISANSKCWRPLLYTASLVKICPGWAWPCSRAAMLVVSPTAV